MKELLQRIFNVNLQKAIIFVFIFGLCFTLVLIVLFLLGINLNINDLFFEIVSYVLIVYFIVLATRYRKSEKAIAKIEKEKLMNRTIDKQADSGIFRTIQLIISLVIASVPAVYVYLKNRGVGEVSAYAIVIILIFIVLIWWRYQKSYFMKHEELSAFYPAASKKSKSFKIIVSILVALIILVLIIRFAFL